MDHPSQLACFQDHGEIRGRGEGGLIDVFRSLAKPDPALKLYCPGGKPSGKLGSKDTGTGLRRRALPSNRYEAASFASLP
jgi:hypothetical protein